MSHSENKVEWCLEKAQKEIQEGRHRGLRETEPDRELARKHVKKAEHNLQAITRFQRVGYPDWSAPAAFYAAYHCFLAILADHGYESRNQECTIALIYNLIEDGNISLAKETVEKVQVLNPREYQESPTITRLREEQQYGVSLSIEDEAIEKAKNTVKEILDKTKELLEE